MYNTEAGVVIVVDGYPRSKTQGTRHPADNSSNTINFDKLRPVGLEGRDELK